MIWVVNNVQVDANVMLTFPPVKWDLLSRLTGPKIFITMQRVIKANRGVNIAKK